jgi:hypothetical protein
MNSRTLLRITVLLSFCCYFAGTRPTLADSSHARIIRLSVVQGDVRFARETHGDPLADPKTGWDTAQLNLPISQGNVLATDDGRAAVEFENGTMAFLSENTVLQFYDLSLNDGARVTRLVLLQGSASFSVNPSAEEYFSVTGGDFTVEANTHALFRVGTYDDGSNVAVRMGRINVLRKNDSTFLAKGQTLSIKAGNDSSLSSGTVPAIDNFDKWVANRVEAINTANNASLRYTSSSSAVPGYADLYTYGAWSSCGGFGYGWRPFGAGFSWSPFSGGGWYLDPAYGWTYMSAQPWGWAPYHYGGWLFDASCGGWFYSPGAYGYGYGNGYGYPIIQKKHFPPRVNPPHPIYHASTAVFVRQNGKIGIVPMNPLDEKGKTPLNLEHGVLAAPEVKGLTAPLSTLDRGQKFETLKSAPREAFAASSVTPSSAPARVSSSIEGPNAGALALVLGKDTLLSYDAGQHRFINTSAAAGGLSRTSGAPVAIVVRGNSGIVTRASVPTASSASARVPTAPASGRSSSAVARSFSPPSGRSFGGSYAGGGASSGRSSSGSGGGSSSASSGASGRSSSSSSSSSGSSGGRAH